MGLAFFHHSEEGPHSADNIRFQGTQQVNCKKTIPYPQNQYHTAGAGRLHICNHTRLKHGLLYRLDSTATEMCTIIFPWGKYLYQRLPMGFAGSADIFQAEMGNLTATLEYVRAYIDNLLVITKGSLDDHLDKLRQVFIQLRNAGLKINATKSVFWVQETEYLGYILTRDGINRNQKRCRQSLRSIRPMTSKNFDNSLVWSNTIGICGRNVVKCWPLSPI